MEAWNHAFDHFAGVRRGYEQTRDEAECDNQQHHDDDALECGLCLAALEPQHHRGDCANHQTADEQWKSEQQVQGDGAADHLGQIGGDGDDLGLHEEHETAGIAHTLAQQFRQGFVGHDAEFGGLILDEHAHGVGEHQHPHQQVAVSCAGGDVGRHITRIDVGHGRHERGAKDAGQRMVMRLLIVVRPCSGPGSDSGKLAFFPDFRCFLFDVCHSVRHSGCRSGICFGVCYCHIVCTSSLHTAHSYSAGMFPESTDGQSADD